MLQALHRQHAAPSGCYITGDPSIGYSLYFRAKDASAGEVSKMRHFTDLCNAGASVIARGAQAITLLSQPQAPQQQPGAGELQIFHCTAMQSDLSSQVSVMVVALHRRSS